jgi:hypothetical protein
MLLSRMPFPPTGEHAWKHETQHSPACKVHSHVATFSRAPRIDGLGGYRGGVQSLRRTRRTIGSKVAMDSLA